MAGALPIFNKINYRRGCFMKKSFQRVIATLNYETSVSSSSVESPDSSVTLSGASAESNGSSNENTEKDKSSSSVKGSEPAEVSSSSAKETKNSSDSKSSSSVKSDDSSSSNKDNSSSSVSSSSSEMQSSSSSVKQSSSSSVVPKSSSSVFEVDSSRLCTPGLGADSMHAGAYKKFTYEGRSYYYLTINGKNQDGKAASVTVMAENLNVGEMVDGNKDQNDDSKIERYCYDNDTMKCEEYGGLYQWAEMMKFIKPNHQGICPDGWRLLTYDDMYVVVHANGNRNGVADIRSMGFGGFNYSGYGLIGAGYLWNYNFKNLDEATYWHYPEEAIRGGDINVKSFSGRQNNTSTAITSQDANKTHGFSVRCVKISK